MAYEYQKYSQKKKKKIQIQMAACPSEGRKPTGQSGSPATRNPARHQVQRPASDAGVGGAAATVTGNQQQFGSGKYVFERMEVGNLTPTRLDGIQKQILKRFVELGPYGDAKGKPFPVLPAAFTGGIIK